MIRLSFISLAIVSSSAMALNASDLNGMEGYSIVATTRAVGSFYGCEELKEIRLENGMSITCKKYQRNESNVDSVVVLKKDTGLEYDVKAIIGNYIYDMMPESNQQ
ncbi:hypothetical protein I6M86_17790 [Citrobacter cronae]|uniref:hypothetical protein n=1 Tax=Citrobacter cronae TaxID=1748967 RepID=UPI00190011E5|nr:hypothetical protein [Citrobacter cronae]MBJ8378404.1 hypothetical protein [Citrobacter cronae]